MDFETIKKANDIKLDGIEVEIERQDATITGVTLRDRAGHVLRVQRGEYSGLRVLVPAAPKVVKRHAVVGMVKGIKVEELFDQEHQASTRREELLEVEGAEVKVEPREVAETADGVAVPF